VGKFWRRLAWIVRPLRQTFLSYVEILSARLRRSIPIRPGPIVADRTLQSRPAERLPLSAL